MSSTTDNTSITLNELQPGHTYIISVAAINKLGTGSYTSIKATGIIVISNSVFLSDYFSNMLIFIINLFYR